MRVGPDWLFDYASLFKSFNVYLDNDSGSCSCTSAVVEDEEEEVVYRPPLVTLESPEVITAIPNTSSSSPNQRTHSNPDVAPLFPEEREIMTRDTYAATQSFMELLFPEPI